MKGSRKRRIEAVALAFLGLLALALALMNVLAWQGAFDAEDDEAATGLGTTDETVRRVPTRPEPGEEPTTTATTTRAAAETPTLRLVAARGECYLLVRRDSAAGELLYEAILPAGNSVGFAGTRLWLRIGAAANLDATLDGEPLALPAGTVDVLVTRAGAELL